MVTSSTPPADRDGFQVAVVCALPEERDAVENAMTKDYKSEGHMYGKAPGDDNHYTTGELGGKPIVLAVPSNMGTVNTRHLVVNMRHSFPNLQYVFVVGIAGGAPFRYDKSTDKWERSDINLGDVIISTQVIGYDFGAELDNGFKRKTAVEDVLPRASTLIASFLNGFKTGKSKAFMRVLETTKADIGAWGNKYERPSPETDRVYSSVHRHKHRGENECEKCNRCTDWYMAVCEQALGTSCDALDCVPDHIKEARDANIHFGRVASGNAVMKSAHRRDILIREENCIAFEMEGAGTWDGVGTIVVKGVVDYADGHKNKTWRKYPAARAALCAKALIWEIELADLPRSRYTERLPSDNLSFVQTSQAQLPPLPASTLPFRRDPHFVDRPELELLQDRLSRPSARVALFGIGGVGKSQIAIEYCHRLREQSPETWVFWIHASDTGRFEQSAREALDRLKVPGRDDPKANVFQLFHAWLEDQRNGTWLLVLDNADEADYLLQPLTKGADHTSGGRGSANMNTIYDYLPISPNGAVLITTRYWEMAAGLVDDADILTIEPMGEQSALSLLRNKLAIQGDHEIAKQLVTVLEYMPLAISQAAAYINQRGPRFSIERYLDEFKRSEKSQTSLLSVDLREHRRDRKAANSIMTTWQISFEHLRQFRPSAAELLSLMSFFDHQGIPESILQYRYLPELHTEEENRYFVSDGDHDDHAASIEGCTPDEDHEHSQNESDDEDSTDSSEISQADEDFEQDIIALRRYSFISDTSTGTVFRMHRLVQLATRLWLRSHNGETYWLEQSLLGLDWAFPSDTTGYWADCTALLPHARLALDLKPQTPAASLTLASISIKAGCHLWLYGSATEAGLFVTNSVAVRNKNGYIVIKNGGRRQKSCFH
ncbi:hypothetical protein E4T39_02783 [Aureobasidium subglaciale]|nr:hypothetical protein E4T39_02783 [Aureobasidium subglaciale]